MKKITVVLILFLSVYLSAGAQKKVSASEQAKITHAIEVTASAMKSMQCTFRQEKTLSLLNDKIVSNGTMHFCQPNLLRWEYTSPYAYTFIINGTKVMMKSSGGKNVIDSRQSKMFKEITQIMVNSVTGKCLTNGDDFNVAIYTDNKEYIAHLTPLKSELKTMFKVIKLYVNAEKNIVTQVELVEKKGDTTKIYLNDVKTNVTIDEKVFSIN